VEFAADVGEVSRKLLPRAPLAEDRLRIPKKCCTIMDCADKSSQVKLLITNNAFCIVQRATAQSKNRKFFVIVV
jgi:hypothetical protein